MIELKNIKKEFIKTTKGQKKSKFLALNDLNLTITDGKIIGLIGPNGAGKTTLLRLIAGILEPNEGTITIDNLTYPKDEITIKKNIAFLSNNTKLYNSISAYELLVMTGEFYEVPKEEINKRINQITSILKLDDFLYNRISKLSTGQMQKINIARCLIPNPKYYILDEATNGLDIISRQIILDFIKEEKQKGKTIIYSTHYLEEAQSICDEVIMLNKGQIIAQGSPSTINQLTQKNNLADSFFTLIGDTK